MDEPARFKGDQLTVLDWFGQLRRSRRVRSFGTIALVALAPILALATFLAFSPLREATDSTVRTLVLLADFTYILVIITLVLREVAQIIASRRAQSAGSRLHLRLTAIFGVVALVPTVVVAILAVLSVNMGLEGWFSDRVSTALGNSVDAAVAYQQEHRDDLEQDARALGAFININRRAAPFLSDGDLRQVLNAGQGQIQRGLNEAFVIDGSGEIRARGARSYQFDYDRPSAEDLAAAAEGGVILTEDRAQNEFRALLRLTAFPDRYLYVSREVDGQIIALLDETEQTVLLYRQVEEDRGRLLFDFALLYLGFATLMILAAIWAGLSFGERLSRPVGQLAGAAQRVGQGDLDVRVREETSDDEIAMLGRLFNQMTRQLKGQRETLIEQNAATEESRRLFDSVLSSVTAGVVGLEPGGRVDFMNRSAVRLLSLVEQRDSGLTLQVAIPEFAPLFTKLLDTGTEAIQEEIKLTRSGKQESLLVRMATRRDLHGDLEGYVVAFDDVTQLVSAQRMAAWGDVARRIAHEIKNPLTPIQLSAERIKRKFSNSLEGEDKVLLEQMTEVIVRQTNDLRRIVDEFSKFARMPEPETRVENIVELLNNAIMLQRAGQPDTRFTTDIPTHAVPAEVDSTMIGQAFTNLLKNGGEAIESLYESGKPEGHEPEIRVAVDLTPETIQIDISDNGIGLPPDRAKLFEPYVTTRDKGTGLGLPIVKKIIEEHGGTLELHDAEPFDNSPHFGAMARVTLPRLADPKET